MNSEELELSLRTEFESYLKGFLADLRQEVSEFQKNFETEFEKHKSQTDEALKQLVKRFDTGVQFDQSFNESVLEHLRLARDEGATITAVAIGEAEKLKESAAPAAEFDKLRDAINEISSKTSQSEILKSLVENASEFAPRGAFFIVKNEHFVGWRAFGDEAKVDETTVRGMQFAMADDTVLAEAVNQLATASANAGVHADDQKFLEGLEFGTPDRMYAIPLVARGRGVAVLYADYGNEGVSLNPEALETLVRVAGLTVELAAAGVQPTPAAAPTAPPPAVERVPEPARTEPEQTVEESYYEEQPSEQTPAVEEAAVEPIEAETFAARDFDYVEAETPSYEATEVSTYDPVETTAAVKDDFSQPAPFEQETATYEPAEEVETVSETVTEYAFEPAAEPAAEQSFVEPVASYDEQVPVERFVEPEAEKVEETTYFEPVEETAVATEPKWESPEVVHEYSPEESADEFPDVIEEPVREPVAEHVPHVEQPAEAFSGSSAGGVSEPLAEVASAQAARTRYRDRNVDLPIEVAEDERRLHNDARRFARLLVSEIKLYNEQKVSEGRQSGDLYDRLREAIDRSRDMYDKRVQQPVADKFDYFHYELVNSLAEGEYVKLGASYPGSKVAV